MKQITQAQSTIAVWGLLFFMTFLFKQIDLYGPNYNYNYLKILYIIWHISMWGIIEYIQKTRYRINEYEGIRWILRLLLGVCLLLATILSGGEADALLVTTMLCCIYKSKFCLNCIDWMMHIFR